MHRTIPSKRKAISLAVMLAGAGVAFPTMAQDIEVEEVVVTGSYIRGSALDAPSPVDVIDRLDIEAQGAAQIWDVIKNLEINSGSTTQGGVEGEGSGLEGTANINLRNLGTNSTLTLINGKRQVSAATVTNGGAEFVDINSIPLVMVDRVEVLTDGGSALYGSDAVAGVVNVIMRTDFEGLELYGDLQQMQGSGSNYDKTVSGIWGWASDDNDTHLVIAGEAFERDPVIITEASFFDENSEVTSTIGSASGFFDVGLFGAQLNDAYINDEITAQNLANGGRGTKYTDPLCAQVGGFTGTRTEDRDDLSSSCREDSTRFRDLLVGSKRESLSASFDHTFSEQTEFYSFFQWSQNETQRGDDGSRNSLGPLGFLPPIGAHQGNPYGPIPAFGSAAELGSAAAFAGNTLPVITNAPIDIANGGPNVPAIMGIQTHLPRPGGNDNVTESETVGGQIGFRGDFEAFSRPLNYDLSYSWSGTSFEQNTRVIQRDRGELAVNGLGGPNCTPNGRDDFPVDRGVFWENAQVFFQDYFPGYPSNLRNTISQALTSNNQGKDGCEFFNPFLTRLTDPNQQNSQELLDWMVPIVKMSDNRNKLAVVDAVVSGELFEMAGGTAQFAAGFQFRQQDNKSRAPLINDPGIPNAIHGYDEAGVPNDFFYVTNNNACSLCVLNWDNRRNSRSWFGELSLPLIENVETQIAVRYEDYGGGIGSNVAPKFAASWRPIEELLLRASFSQSFRAPNIGIVKNGLNASSTRTQDVLSDQAVRAGLLPPIPANAEEEATFTLGTPSPMLGNETADTFNVGFLWTPGDNLEGLSIGADIWRFELTDKVVPQPAVDALKPETAAFLAAVGNPDNYVLNESLELDAAERNIACNPNDLEAEFGRDSDERLECVVHPNNYQVLGIRRAVGSTANLITTTLASINAGSIESDGIDVTLGYNWQTDLGQFRLGLNYTHVRQYKLIGVPGLEQGLQGTQVFDAAGTTGDAVTVSSLPDNKGNISFNWRRDNQSLTVINRHIGSYRDLLADGTYANGNDLVRSLVRSKIDSYQTWDFQYNYTKTWDNASFGTTNFSLGILDAFEADVPYREAGTGLGYDARVFDGRGRRIYARVLMQL